MTRRTVTELYTQAQTDFADNTSGDITAEKLRDFCLDLLDTFRPSYGAISIDTPIQVTATPAYIGFPWETILAAQVPDYTVDLPQGNIVRANGPASARVSFSIDAVFSNNETLTFALFINDVETPWAVANTSAGNNDEVAFSFSALTYNVGPTVTYNIKIKCSAAENIELSHGVFAVENVPVNTNA